MKPIIKIIIIIFLSLALINQIVGDNLQLTITLLWITHLIRMSNDILMK